MTLDKRLHAYRQDLADKRLETRVEAARFVEGELASCALPLTGLHQQPNKSAMQLTQVLMGELLRVFERKAGWAWVQLLTDSYVGYVLESALTQAEVNPTHHITVPLSHSFPKADMKSSPAFNLPMNAGFTPSKQTGDFLHVSDEQFVFAAHCSPITTRDFVSVAERFLHVPYLWGGKTALGIDCSGLVQVSMQACGFTCPRDSDMQEADVGQLLQDAPLRRGDLVFWKGHVGLMQDEQNLLHANAHHMMVVSEPLAAARSRMAARGSEITSIRRVQ